MDSAGDAVRTDEELVREYQETREKGGLDVLVKRHIARVRSLIFPMVLSHQDADDLTQEVFCRAIAGLSSFNHNSQFSTWLYRITMNTVHSFLKRRSASPISQEVLVHDEFAVAGPTPVEEVMTSELSGAIGQALSSLRPKLRAAIVLTAVNGLCVGDAAGIESCSRATLYWRVFEARRILKQKLKEYLQT